MKQIFDWLREQTEAKAFRQGFSNDVLVKVEEVGNIIDEAEAKWEAEVCEWKPTTYSMLDGKKHGYKTDCGNGHICGKYKTIISHYKYCHYCGQKLDWEGR